MRSRRGPEGSEFPAYSPHEIDQSAQRKAAAGHLTRRKAVEEMIHMDERLIEMQRKINAMLDKVEAL